MHPNPAFRMARDPLAFVADAAFAHIFAVTADGPRVAHVPVLVADGRLRFHLARGNALAAALDGGRALASIATPGSYVSPNWYEAPANAVPTWNYAAVEIEGPVRALDLAGLEALLEASAATFEPRVGEGWTMAKMERAKAEAMMRAIIGYELLPETIRTTDKASQNRSDADARGVIAAMRARGNHAGADHIAGRRGW